MNRTRYVVEAHGDSGEHLLYNTANGAFVALDNAAHALWADGGESGPAAEALAGNGFFTDLSAEQELARQQALFDAERADTSHLTLSLIPTYICNFRCPYCYELGHNKTPGKMDARTMDTIESFVQFKHEQDGFTRLSVQWYGGDPSLALDEVAQLTTRLTAWTKAHGVSYDAVMLTNANVIDEDAARTIAECDISMVFLTIDGPEKLHNRRRVAANGTNSYERTIQAARLLRSYGIRLVATMNTDKVNIKTYESLRRRLLEEEGITLSMAKLNDYGHFFGEAPFCSPDFDLFEHEEFFHAQFEEFAKHDHTADELREMLRPIKRFCTGQYDNYFIIDLLCDVYRCDGRVGEKQHVRFNLFDDPETWKLHEVSFDATRDEKCSACELLPLCQGNCIWERESSGMPCHPFKTTIGDYLNLYRACIGEVTPGKDGVTILADPFPAEELGWH